MDSEARPWHVSLVMRGLRIPAVSAAFALLAGCSLPLPGLFGVHGELADSPSVRTIPPIVGRVDFGDGRHTQASMSDIAKAATVSLIDTATNETRATTLTDASGRFILSFPNGFLPRPNFVYALEGIKGLGNNIPGKPAARVRTLSRFTGSWETITAGTVTITPSTTALAIMGALFQGAGKPGAASDPAQYLNLISQTSGQVGVPDTLAPGQTVVSQATYEEVYGYVSTAVGLNVDPVAAVQYASAADDFTPLNLDPNLPSITGVFPPAAVRGAEVTMFGTNLDSAEVYVAGYKAEVKQASKTSLKFLVPDQAVSGDLQAIALGGDSNTVAFTVFPDPGGYFEP